MSKPVHGFTQEQRAARIDAALTAYCPLVGYEANDTRNELTLAGLIADARHWCAVHGYDFHFALEMAASFWNDEQAPDDPS